MNNEGVVRIDTAGLPTEVCLHTLLYSTDDNRAIHVCFGASYDVNMMLKDIPEVDLRRLHAGDPIDFQQYQLSYRPHKSFEVREYMTVKQKYIFNPKTGKREGWYKKSITLWDVFGFFQYSFVETLSKYFTRGTQVPEMKEKYTAIIAKIKEGKDKRGTFTEDELKTFIMPYCELEVKALNELMETLHGYLLAADMKIARWDGAGACAAAMFKKYKVKEHIALHNIPEEVIKVSEYAFFGGRIETLRYGNYEGKVYHKDINSAYPYAMSLLPSFKNGMWKHHKNPDYPVCQFQDVTVFLVSWSMPNKSVICPFPWRDKAGNVFFPPKGKAWVWKPEVLAALDNFSDCRIHIHEAWEFFPENDVKPFAFIPEVYALRQQLVEEGNGAEKVLKLGLNSLYGKTAQSIGYNEKEGKKPPYHNLVVAGMVTSTIRAMLVNAAMQHPESVIMLATDGIYSTRDIDVPTSDKKKLGEWESSIHRYMTIVASGVYWYQSEGEDENAFSRGFDKYTLLRHEILQKWRTGDTHLECPTTRFVGIGSAIGLNDFRYWRTWRTIQRKLGLNMESVAKRIENGNRKNPANGLVRTYASIPKQMEHATVLRFPYERGFMLSHKYSFRWDTTDATDMLDGIRMRDYLDEVANTTS